ncbi:hypothetical protein FISHEDRAFT_76154 [Fistulina hepatica ATCC 64428]|uniref:Six-hairpin glycosidase n=1 Tax=Fistulina hepatica ATCC 64428 TaxID=1128425 RepID=A0A0D7A6C6_9AGAR|nr:hypothetical protein FISHEDRAFT_76154 [Fistulina hepatica ATCC 64428]
MYIPANFTYASALLLGLQPGLDNETVAQVRDNLLASAHQSWELGTAAEAFLELECPSLSVFRDGAFSLPTGVGLANICRDEYDIAYEVVSNKPADSLPLIANDGSAGDPASLGVSVLLANWTRSDLSITTWADDAEDQLDYLLYDAPRTSEGAISHRADQVQLWSDFVYMVPPFLAYYGALQGGDNGTSLLQDAYDQIRLYRDALRDDDGLWRHVALGTWQDTTHWATGNAWAAAGMLRVLQTLNRTEQASSFQAQQANLTSWVWEILTAAWSYQLENGTLHNTIDDNTTFSDASSTALLASVTYRLAAFENDTSQVYHANKALKAIEDSVNSTGWLMNTVDPYTFTSRTADDRASPEGQAFILLLDAAWREYATFYAASYSV